MAQGSGPSRSTAIVLFTDVVGSTELRSRLGEDAAERLRHRHDTLAAEAVEAGAGHLVKNLGDGIMATFAGAAGALHAAIAIQHGIGRHNCSGGTPLEVRIGISAGDVVLEEDDCFGTPVIEAARLCAAAAGGQILASEMVRWLARSDELTFTPVGSLQLKGLPEPVPAVQVDYPALPGSVVPLPHFLTEIGRIFVGRDRELERLTQLGKEVAEGELRVALLAGEPGVGKTRLAAELARRLHEGGTTVLAGRCDEDLGVPYQPFVEALRYFLDHVPNLTNRLGRYGGELARLVPELSERVPELAPPLRSDPETERYRLFDAVAAWLAAASQDDPVLVVLDDLQWAAKPTLLMLRHLIRAGGARVLVLGTYRDTELTHDHPLVELVADLRRQGGVERVALGGLDGVAVRDFVELASGHTLDESGLALAHTVYEETEGNPFFVGEVLRHLAETGAVERREGLWSARLPVDQLAIPEGVRDVIGRRLARLSEASNQLLRVAAVAGAEFELDVLQAAADLTEDALLTALEEAAGARVITEVSATRFRFAHALIRATLYDALSATRRVTLHRRTAEAIERNRAGGLEDYLPALALHWAKASTPVTEVARAVDYARRAADRALAQLAHDEAAGYYGSALELLDAGGGDAGDPRRLDLLIGLGEAQRRADDPSYRQTLLDAAHLADRLGDADALARAALANTLGHIWTAPMGVDTDRIQVLELALARIGEDDLPMRARLMAILGLEMAWEPDPARRLALSAEALQIARALPDRTTLAHVLLARDYTISAPENARERLAATAELLAIAEDLADPVLASRALCLRVKATLELADVEEAERCVSRNTALVADLGQRSLTWASLHHRATLYVLHDHPGHHVAVEAAGDIAPPGLREFFINGALLRRRLEQGRAHEVEEYVRALAQRMGTPLIAAYLARVLVENDKVDEAADLFDGLAENGFAHPTNNVAWLMFLGQCAWLTARLGRSECVGTLRADLAPYADQLMVGAFAGFVHESVGHYLGLLDTLVEAWPTAEAYFATAAGTYERIDAPVWLARIRVDWARMLLRRGARGDEERAHEFLQQALGAARTRGLTALERDAATLLSA